MNTELIGHLVRLRYKLMWARTRTRNGKIALFLAGYILLIMVIAIFSAGGIGAGIVAVRTGKGYPVAAALLAGMYVQAALASVLLGFGMNTIFSDAEMRRYPLRSGERLLVRHLIGILDPFWYLILALEVGLALGMYVYGAGSFWLGIVGVLLLFISNYLFARVIGQLVERLVSKKGGSTLLLALIVCLGMLPGVIGPRLGKGSPALRPLVEALRYTPPAGAAQSMTHLGFAGFGGWAVVAAWIVGLASALAVLESRPIQTQVVQASEVSWESPFERVGGWLGAENAVLVGQWLRFFSRNNRFRMAYPLAIPINVFLLRIFTRQAAPGHRYLLTLGVFTLVGFMGTLQFAANQFGYVGGGFRRYMLLPTDPAAVLRTGSYTFVLLGSALIPIATLLLMIFPPFAMDWRTPVMFTGVAWSAVFLLNGIALWVTLYSPRRGNYKASFGNDLSFAANVLVIGSVLTAIFVPQMLEARKLWPNAVEADRWWIAIPLLPITMVTYFISLRRAEHVFVARREQLLAVIESRS
ncbi:MAG TPA: hypothetical protein VMH81_37085 [Bryobacteraceae bacterium]|nr:hypothetical protein [Bryobacteraceae bacterium]